jgi:hypothetical protein
MAGRFRKLGMEQMEERQMMAANVMAGGAATSAFSPKLNTTPVQVAAQNGAQLATTATIGNKTEALGSPKGLSAEQLRTMDQAVASLAAAAKLSDGQALAEQIAGENLAGVTPAELLKGVTGALLDAGVSQNMIDRLFGTAGAAGAGGLGQSAPEFDPLGLSDHPGWTAGQPDLASFRSGSDAEAGISGEWYDSPVKWVDYDQNGVTVVRMENGLRMVLVSDGATKTDGVRQPAIVSPEGGEIKEEIEVVATDNEGNKVVVSIEPNAPGRAADVTTTEKNKEAEDKRMAKEENDAAERERNRKEAEEQRKKAAEELAKKKSDAPKTNPNPFGMERGATPTFGQVLTTLTGGVTDPADEFSGRDFDVARFVRSLVGFLQSKINPNPNGPTIDLGGGTVPSGPLGGDLPDPVDDTPKHPIMAPKPKTGPNPVPPLPPGARNEAFAALANTSGSINGVGALSTTATRQVSAQSVVGLKPTSIVGK